MHLPQQHVKTITAAPPTPAIELYSAGNNVHDRANSSNGLSPKLPSPEVRPVLCIASVTEVDKRRTGSAGLGETGNGGTAEK